MTGDGMFAVAWLSMMVSVFTWGAVMMVAAQTLQIRPRRALIATGQFEGESWFVLTVATLIVWPIAAGMLAYDAVLINREVNR